MHINLRRIARTGFCGAILTVVLPLAAGCGSSSANRPATTPTSATPVGTASVATSSGATDTAGGGSGGTLTVTGAFSATLTESADSSSSCKLDPYGSGGATDVLSFDSPTASYKVQLSLPAGTVTFPDQTKKASVALYDSTNSTKEWAAGTTTAPGSGSATRSADNKSGTLDLMMTGAAPGGGSSLTPLHLSGAWTCP